jgi:hypothetical protein
MINIRTFQKNFIVLVLLIVALVISGCSPKPKNNTPIEGAKVFIEAMVNSDAELMEYINHSDAFAFPPQYCLEIATKRNMALYDLDQFQYKDMGNGKVKVTFPDGGVKNLEMVEESGKWYFSRM